MGKGVGREGGIGVMMMMMNASNGINGLDRDSNDDDEYRCTSLG